MHAILLPSTPTRWRRSIRTSLVLALAVFLSLLMQFEQVAWTFITIFILSMPEVGTTWRKAGNRIFGTLIGAFGGMAMIAMFPQSPNLMIIFFSLVLFSGLYLSMTMITSMYTYFMVVVTMIIVSTSAWDDPLGVQDLALERFQNTMLGVLCVTFGATCIWPIKAEDQLIDSMLTRITRARNRIAASISQLDGETIDPVDLLLPEKSALAEQLTLFQAASMESHLVGKHRETVMVLLTLVDRLASMAAEINLELGSKDGRLCRQVLELDSESQRAIRDTLVATDRVLAAVEETRRGRINRLTPELKHGVRDAIAKIDEVRDRCTDPGMLSFCSSVRRLGDGVDLLDVFDRWCVGELVEAKFLEGEIPLVEARLNRSIFEPFQRINQLAFRTAIKATVASVVALLIVASMRWTSVGATAIVTCVLVMLPTIGGSVAKSLQRLGGAIVGAVLGIAVIAALAPNTIDVGVLLFAVMGIGFISQWIMLARWDLSYAGMQIGFAFAVTALAFAFPTDDIYPGIDRVFGIFVGIVVAFSVMWLLWPVRATTQLLYSIAESLRLMGSFLQRGLLTAEEEELVRPLNGFRYRIAWLLADAYRYRQEARFERKLLPTADAPVLKMGVSLQAMNLRIHAVVRNRLEHERVRDIGRLDVVHELLLAIERRMDAVAELVQYGTPLPPSELDAHLDAVKSILDSMPALDESERLLVRTQVGYYQEVVELMPRIESDAMDTFEVFGR